MIERRLRYRKNLNNLYLPFYDTLCSLLPEEPGEDGYSWQPCAGIRSFMAQDRLYAQGRTTPGSRVTNAKGGESPHNYGCATDWCLWTEDGEPHWPTTIDPRWQVYIDAVETAGLRSGVEFDDFPHNELRIAVPWTTIATIWRDRGPAHANASIMAAMVSIKKDDDGEDVVI
jgi:hypothetical protein